MWLSAFVGIVASRNHGVIKEAYLQVIAVIVFIKLQEYRPFIACAFMPHHALQSFLLALQTEIPSIP